DAFEGLGLDPHGFGTELRSHSGGLGEEQITGEDGYRIAPHLMRGRCPATHGSVVHDVVVVQRCQVDEFDGHGRVDDVVLLGLTVASGQQHEVRTGTFATG